MSRAALTVLACIGLISLGCDDGRGSDDAGGITLMDAGDGDAGPGGGVDAGPGGCPPASAPAPQMPMACAGATLTCLQMAAGNQAMQMACIMNDPNPMVCNGCLVQDVLFTCSSTAGGCSAQYGEIQCCLMAACPTADAACLNAAAATGGACAAQVMAFDGCSLPAQMAMRCGVTGTCFQTGMGGFFPEIDSVEPMTRNWSTPRDNSWLVEQFVGSW